MREAVQVSSLQDDCGTGAGGFLADGPGEADELADGAGDGAGELTPLTPADPAGVIVGEAVPRKAALSCGAGDGLARMSSHVQSSPAYPPISFSKAAQRSCSFCKSGGRGGSSAEPGKTIYVIFRSLAGRLYGFDRGSSSLQIRNEASPIL